MAFTIVNATVFQYSPLPHIFRVGRLVADTFRRLIPNISLRNAAIIASSSPIPNRCLATSKRGVSVIVLPGDVSLKDAVVEGPRVRFHEPKSNVCPSDEELNTLAEL